jgi:hypothetical protein
MVEQVERRGAIAGLTLWRGTRWRVASRGFAWWAASTVIAGTRHTVGFEQWLRDKEYQGILTREQAERMRSLGASVSKGVVSGMEQIGKSLLDEVLRSGG